MPSVSMSLRRAGVKIGMLLSVGWNATLPSLANQPWNVHFFWGFVCIFVYGICLVLFCFHCRENLPKSMGRSSGQSPGGLKLLNRFNIHIHFLKNKAFKCYLFLFVGS